MISAQVNSNLAGFNRALGEYLRRSKLSPQDAILKQSAKLGYSLAGFLALLAPGRGSIIDEALARFKRGEGIKIGKGVRAAIAAKYNARSDVATRRVLLGKGRGSSVVKAGRGLNLQALMAQRELQLREHGIGFARFIGRLSGIETTSPEQQQRWFGRYQQLVSAAGFRVEHAGSRSKAEMIIDWPAQAGAVLRTTKGQAALAGALGEVEADMRVYLQRKQAEDARILERF